MIGLKLIITAITICLAIGVCKGLIKIKISSVLALLACGCLVFYMFNNPTEFNNIGKLMTSWVYDGHNIIKSEVSKQTNTNTNNNGLNFSDDNGKVE